MINKSLLRDIYDEWYENNFVAIKNNNWELINKNI